MNKDKDTQMKEEVKKKEEPNVRAANNLKARIVPRLSARLKEIDEIERYLKEEQKKLDEPTKELVPLCGWQFRSARRNILRVMAKLRK
jgi:hypothetical protein|tara:strand:+ start:251 stop:514 length:264 start_codon:yes stop_codon:yes gene_type:complete